LKSCTNSNFKFMQQFVFVTVDHDPLLGLSLTPTKRMTSDECEILLKVGWNCSNIYKLWNCSNIQFLFLYCPCLTFCRHRHMLCVIIWKQKLTFYCSNTLCLTIVQFQLYLQPVQKPITKPLLLNCNLSHHNQNSK